MQVQSLSNSKYPTRILISRGHERFVNELHLHNATIVNHSSSKHRREEKSDQVNQDSDKPAFGKPMQGSKVSDNVGMREKPSNQLRETVASTMFGVIPASSRETAASWNDSELVSIHSRTESSRRDRNIQIYTRKEISMKDRVWNTIAGFPHNKRHSIEARISKEVTHMVRHRDQDEREEDGAMHWDAILPKLRKKFQSQLDKECANKDWIDYLYRGSYKTRFEICKDADGELVYIRSIQGHSGGVTCWVRTSGSNSSIT